MDIVKFSLWSQNGGHLGTYLYQDDKWYLAGMLEPVLSGRRLICVGLTDDELEEEHCREWDLRVAEIRRLKAKSDRDR